MSSNIRIHKICQHCGVDFIAKTTVTKYCGDSCAKKAYKARKREEKIRNSEKETKEVIQRSVSEWQAKGFLQVREFCQLFKVSRTTVWRMSRDGKLKTVKIGRQKYISRDSIDQLFR